jgi:exopolyphosphatase/guanosine-5'-triphosphate,3'-diphosphate pyrophosphatase
MTDFELSPDGTKLVAIESRDDQRNVLVWNTDALSAPPRVISATNMRIVDVMFLKNDMLGVVLWQPFDSRIGGQLSKTFISKLMVTDLEGKVWREPLATADIARTDVILAPGVGLKEGIVHDLVARRSRAWDPRLDEHLATRATIQLGRRYHFDEPHATQVDRLACQLFDRLVPLHRLGPEDRVLLRVAALGHDIGDFIDYASHHKHTQYILEHSNVMGLSQDHRAVASCIARYHRRAVPSPKHEGYGRLGAEEQRKVKKLSAILRVADALDRGHRSKVQKLEVTTTGRDVLISAHGREDLSLEVWTAERKAEYFEQMFGKKIRVVSEVG